MRSSINTIVWAFTLSLVLFYQVSDAGIISEINDFGIPYEEHKPVSHHEPYRYKREFKRVHPEMGNTTYTYDAMVKEHVVLVTPEKGIVALKCARNSLDLYLTSDVNISQFKVGAVLVGGPEYQCVDEDGDLTAAYHEVLGVVGVFNSKNYMRSSVVVKLITKEVTLMELFHYARVHVHHIPNHRKPTHALMNPNSNASLEIDERFKFHEKLEFTVGKRSPVQVETENLKLSCDSCYFRFHVEFEFVLDFSYWWLFPTGVDRFKVFFGGGALLNLDISATLLKTGKLPAKMIPLTEVPLTPITFAIGPVPVVIVPEVKISFSFQILAEASVALTFGFDAGVHAGLGLEFTSARGFQFISDFGLPANLHRPKVVVGGKIFVRGALVPEIVAKIYGLFPVAFSVQPFVELILESTSDPDRACGAFIPEFRIDNGLQLIVEAQPIDFKLFKAGFGGLLPLTATINLIKINTVFSICLAKASKNPAAPTPLNIPRYMIKADPWGPCSAYCGPGNRTRDVYCFDFDTQTKVDRSNCNGTYPETIKPCDVRECRPCGARTCGDCISEPGCAFCYQHGGRCDVASNVTDNEGAVEVTLSNCQPEFTATANDTCAKPVKILAVLPSVVAPGDVQLQFEGGLANEAIYVGYSYDGKKWYHGGLFDVHPYQPIEIVAVDDAEFGIVGGHVILEKYKGCLPPGKITLGMFSLVTQHTSFTSITIGSPNPDARCVVYSPYNTCSRTCGPATQTRNYTCFNGGVEGCDQAQEVEVHSTGVLLNPLTIDCEGNKPCFDKPMRILHPESITLAVNKQKLYVSWIGGQDYEQVNIAYRYMKNFYNETWHSWIPFPQSPFPNTGSTNISLATGYPAHTFYQVQVCSSVNSSNCDISSSFTVTKPVKYLVRFVNPSLASSTITTAAPTTTPAPSSSTLLEIDLPPITIKLRDAQHKRKVTQAPAATSFTATLTLRGVALNYTEVTTNVAVSIPAGQSTYSQEFVGYDIGFIYSLDLQFKGPSRTTTPSLIVTARSATQRVTFGVNVPLSGAKPLVQRYSCEGNEQAPCEAAPAASGCGWCDLTQSCMAGSTTKGFDTAGNVVCTGSQWHPNNQSYYTFSQITLNQTVSQQNKRDITSILTTSSITSEALNATEVAAELGESIQSATQPGDEFYETSEYESQTRTSYDPSTVSTTDSTQSSTRNWDTSNDDPLESVTTLSSVDTEELTTPSTTTALYTDGLITSTAYSSEDFPSETSSSSVSQDPSTQAT